MVWLRSIDASMNADIVAAIDDRLGGVAAEQGVRIPWAIESGSRAWGFPSPDSDYDCRFFYVRTAEEYLSPWRPRDVIETPLDAIFDVNGWDLIKAVRLAVRGNATVGEWLRSPLIYGGDGAFRDELLALVDAVTTRPRLRRHYLYLGRRQRALAGLEGEKVRLKRLFYAVRPAATLHWLDTHPHGNPPMRLQELLAEVDIPPTLRDTMAELISVKSVTRELGEGTVPRVIADYISVHLDRPVPVDVPLAPDAHARAADTFRGLVTRFAP